MLEIIITYTVERNFEFSEFLYVTNVLTFCQCYAGFVVTFRPKICFR